MRLARLLETVDCEGLRDLFQAFFASIPYEWHAARRCRRANNDIANYEGYYASVFYSYFAALGYEITVRGSRRSEGVDGRGVDGLAPPGSALAQRQGGSAPTPAAPPLDGLRQPAYAYHMPRQEERHAAQAPRRARLFRNGRNQALRIPRDLEFAADEVILHREDDRLVVEPVKRKRTLAEILPQLEPIAEEFPEIPDPPVRSEDVFRP